MTPKEYLAIAREQDAIIDAAEQRIAEARKLADKCPMPKNVRPAGGDDIVAGAVIWHKQERRYGGNFWNVVAEPLRYGDPFKAYVADDGCRYGLQDAYIEEPL